MKETLQPSDLRIGNLVHYKMHDHSLSCKVVKGIYSIRQIQLSGIGHPINPICALPIPLSPEILEKCGGKYGKVDFIASLDDDPQEGGTEWWDFIITANENWDSLTNTLSIVRWGNRDFWFSNDKIRVKIRYLHQLQNLYYALTGQELQIKL